MMIGNEGGIGVRLKPMGLADAAGMVSLRGSVCVDRGQCGLTDYMCRQLLVFLNASAMRSMYCYSLQKRLM